MPSGIYFPVPNDMIHTLHCQLLRVTFEDDLAMLNGLIVHVFHVLVVYL